MIGFLIDNWFAVAVAATFVWLLLRVRGELVERAETVRAQRSNIGVALETKLQLINRLVDVVQSYQHGEQLVHLKVSQDLTTASMAAAYQQGGALLSAVQGVAQRFPEITSGPQYQDLARQITNCERDLQKARLLLNTNVKDYNMYRKRVIAMLFAPLLGYGEESYLEFDHTQLGESRSMAPMQTRDNARIDGVLDQVHALPNSAQPALSAVQPAIQLPASVPSAPPSANGPAMRKQSGGTMALSAPPSLSIRFVAGPCTGQVVPIGAGSVLGREAPSAEIVVADPQVSSQHAWIGWRNGAPTFADQGSTNGSFVNGQPARPGEEIVIKNGDEIALGGTTAVRFVVQLGQQNGYASAVAGAAS